MAKPAMRAYSHQSLDVARLLGQAIRIARNDRRMTLEELAERAGLSRGLVRRIEAGDMGCSIGAVLEAATIAGVPLFDLDRAGLASTIAGNDRVLTLLPQSVRKSSLALKDDF